MEIKKEVKIYKIYKVCPRCKKGHMVSADSYTIFNNFLFGDSIKYEHTCSNCGYKEEYDKIYPFEETEEEPGVFI